MAINQLFHKGRQNQMADKPKTKKLYIAAPFFNDAQLGVVTFAEGAIRDAGLQFYSPRNDGVLQDMAPEVRVAEGLRLFALNKQMIEECDAVLALLDHKDTGTIWETGYAHGIGQPVFGYASGGLNIMVRYSLDAAMESVFDLTEFLRAYGKGEPLEAWATKPSADVS